MLKKLLILLPLSFFVFPVYSKKSCINNKQRIEKSSQKSKRYIPFGSSSGHKLLSKKARYLEKRWKALNDKILLLNDAKNKLSSEINKQRCAISSNILETNTPGAEDVLKKVYCSKINENYKLISSKFKELKKICCDIKIMDNEQKSAVLELDNIKDSMLKIEKTKLRDASISDILSDIAKRSSCIDTLISELESELSVGRLRYFIKQKSYFHLKSPVEAISVRKILTNSSAVNCKKNDKMIAINMKARSGSFIFSPCSGNVVFSENFAQNNIIIIKCCKAIIVVNGISESYAAVGDVLHQGDIIGNAKKRESTNELSDVSLMVKK